MTWEVAYIDRETATPLAVHIHSNGSLEVRNADTDVYYSLTTTQMTNIYNTIKALVVSTLPSRIAGLGGIVLQGPKSDLPVAGQPGGDERFYIATDEGAWYRDVGYQWKDSDAEGGPTYTWEDISGTGTAVTLADDAYETADIGFTFPFLKGHKTTQVHIGSNGLLGLGSDSAIDASSHQPIPSSGTPNDVVCPFWDNLDPSVAGTIHYETLGTDPERRFIVQYTGVRRQASTDLLTFQVVLYENGQIVFQYKDMPGDGDGSSATIGIEGKDGETGVQVSHDTAYVKNELAVLIEPVWELMFGADALAQDSAQRTLKSGAQGAAAGDHNHDLPDAPANLVGVGGNEKIVLTWDKADSPSVTSYEYHDSVTSIWEPIPDSGRDTTTYTMEGLTNGVAYTAQVRAVNSYAEGDGTGEASSVTATPAAA